MNRLKRCKLRGLFGLFLLTLFYPAAGKIFDAWIHFDGVVQTADKPVFTKEAVMDGSFQNSLEVYMAQQVPGRNIMVKIQSQILYSIFNVSSNPNVVIGRNKQLFEPEYLNYSFNLYGQPSDDEIAELADKLVRLQEVLEEKGKQLYIFVTPSKARYYADDAPYDYQLCAPDGKQELAYDKFIRQAEKTDLKVFDTIAYIDAEKDKFEFPLWYPTGIHWSRALGYHAAAAFFEYLQQESGYELGQIDVSVHRAEKYEDPDADLYKILNLILPPSTDYFEPQLRIAGEGADKPNVFLRGGSFMGQSLSALIRAGIFGRDIHFENNYYFTDRYSSLAMLSDFDAYDEVDVSGYLAQSDIVILEVNESKIHTMSWGFIDYVLELDKGMEGRDRK